MIYAFPDIWDHDIKNKKLIDLCQYAYANELFDSFQSSAVLLMRNI